MKKTIYLILIIGLMGCMEDNGLDVNCLCSEEIEIYDEFCEPICKEVI